MFPVHTLKLGAHNSKDEPLFSISDSDEKVGKTTEKANDSVPQIIKMVWSGNLRIQLIALMQ